MSEAAIQLRGVGKMYKTYPSHVHRAFDAMGFSRLVPFYRPRYAEFWALRGIDLELAPGQRVGGGALGELVHDERDPARRETR